MKIPRQYTELLPRTRIGFSLPTKASILDKLRVYMTFMNDPSLNGRAGYPETRASWPGIDGSPTDAYHSPLAQHKFFDWQVGASAGMRDGEHCIDYGAMANLLYAIGQDRSAFGADVVSAALTGMGNGTCVTWNDWFHSIFGPTAIDNSVHTSPAVAPPFFAFFHPSGLPHPMIPAVGGTHGAPSFASTRKKLG